MRKNMTSEISKKKTPGWVLGGLIGASFYLILLVIAYILFQVFEIKVFILSISFFGLVVTNLVKYGDLVYFLHLQIPEELLDLIIIYTISHIPYMSIGALIGAEKKRYGIIIFLIIITLLLILFTAFVYLTIQV